MAAVVATSQEQESTTQPQQCWAYTSAGSPPIAQVADGSLILISVGMQLVKALEAVSGEEQWSTEIGGILASNVVVSGERFALVSNRKRASEKESGISTVRWLSKRTGITLVSKNLMPDDRFWLHAFGYTTVVVSSRGVIYAISENGEIVWNLKTEDAVVAGPFFGDHEIVYVGESGSVMRVNAQNGEIATIVSGTEQVTSVTTDRNGVTYIGDRAGRIRKISHNRSNGWILRSGGRIEEVFVSSRGIAVASVDNFLYMVGPSRGNVVWKRRLPGRLAGATLLIHEAIVVGIAGMPSIFVIDLNTGRITNRFELADNVEVFHGPVSGPGQNFLLSLRDRVIMYGLDRCPEK
jgi:outer membrane protein assembly factor BamB